MQLVKCTIKQLITNNYCQTYASFKFVENLLDVESIYIRYGAFPPMKKLVMSLGFAYRSSLHIKSDTAHRIIRVLSQPSSFKDHKTITGTTVWSKVSYVLSCSITFFALHEI